MSEKAGSKVVERHFLAVRDSSRRLVRIEVFEDPDAALDRYAEIEGEQFMDPYEPDCCLFGADSLATLCRTHPSWFCPETIDVHAHYWRRAMAEQLEGGVEALERTFEGLTERARQQNAELDALADEWIANREPGWKTLQFIRERDRLTQQRDDLLAWLEEVATGAEHVAEKLKREAEDFEDRAFYEDAERFTVQAAAYRAVIQRLKEEA